MKENKSLKCRVRGCDRPYSLQKHKLCPAHLMRLRRNGTTGSGKLNEPKYKQKDEV